MGKKYVDLEATHRPAFRVGMRGSGQRAVEFFNGFLARLQWNPTANRAITLPDQSGTVPLISSSTNRIEGLLASSANGQPVVHEQLGSGFNPNVITHNWPPGAPVNNSTAEVPILSFKLGGASFQPFTTWEIDTGFSVIQNSGTSTLANLYIYIDGNLIASNQNNDNLLITGANERSGILRIRITALSETLLAGTVLLRLGLGQSVDRIDKGNSWDHTGEFSVAVPSLTTVQTLNATFQSEVASPSISVTPRFATMTEIKPEGSLALFHTLPYRVSGSYITPEVTVAASASTFVHGTGVIKAAPILIEKAESINQIWSDVSALLAGATYRIGLYTSLATGYPGTLIAGTDVQAYDAATTGVKTGAITPNLILQPGWYWFAWAVSSSATMALRGLPASNTRSISGNPNTGAVNSYSHLQANFVYGAMPATFPAGAGLQLAANGGVLKMLLRRA
ncbi:MAG: hypothetical protein ACRC62_37670 [Microcoleus sp.]